MKRFTETLKWEDPWYRRLSPVQKCLWGYLCDKCDHAGVIDLDYEAVSFQVGAEVSEADLQALGERVEKLPCGKAWIRKFVRFQYGELSTACKAHLPVYAAIKKHGLDDRVLIPTALPVASPLRGLQEADKDKETEKVGGESREEGIPNWPRVSAYAAEMGLAEWKARDFFDEMEGCGWLDYNKRPIRKWQNVLNRVRTKWEADGRPMQPPNNNAKTINGNTHGGRGGAPNPRVADTLNNPGQYPKSGVIGGRKPGGT